MVNIADGFRWKFGNDVETEARKRCLGVLLTYTLNQEFSKHSNEKKYMQRNEPTEKIHTECHVYKYIGECLRNHNGHGFFENKL